MGTDLAQLVRFGRSPHVSEAHLTACPLCLRVLRGSEWIDAEHVIRQIRSYDLDAPPELRSMTCEICVESIFSRRLEAREPSAA